MENFIKILEHPLREFQIVIFRHETGNYTYSKRFWDINAGDYGDLGPACGIYDTPETAEVEARMRNDLGIH